MTKIILYKGDGVLKEIALCKERITIGRRPHNDIVIEDLAISGEHAVIVTHADGSFLEDLNSTNGTQVNGQPVRKHFLQDGDVIELAQYEIRFLSAQRQDARQAADLSENGYGQGRMLAASESAKGIPFIRVLNGGNSGKEIPLIKALTTIGKPGGQVAIISQSAAGYYVTHVEGSTFPLINGRSIGNAVHLLGHEDVIELAGTRMSFLLT